MPPLLSFDPQFSGKIPWLVRLAAGTFLFTLVLILGRLRRKKWINRTREPEGRGREVKYTEPR